MQERDERPDFDQERASELTQLIAESVVADRKFEAAPWVSIALVSIMNNGSHELSGYWYAVDGRSVAETPDDYAIFQLFSKLRKATAVPGKRMWKTCLVQINRDSMKVSVEFEHDDVNRWKVTPTNLKRLVPSLRPS